MSLPPTSTEGGTLSIMEYVSENKETDPEISEYVTAFAVLVHNVKDIDRDLRALNEKLSRVMAELAEFDARRKN